MDAFLAELTSDELRRITCAPHPRRWKAFGDLYSLEWDYVPFERAAARRVPNTPGVYCFYLGNPPRSLPSVGYPLYVGKTARTLRKRFGEYVDEQQSAGGRTRVRKFLKVFEGELYFSCAPFRGSPAEVRDLETALHDALMPSYSDIGFSAQVRSGRMAWQ